MTGKTREQMIRTLERKPDVPKEREVDPNTAEAEALGKSRTPRHSNDFLESRYGMNQESDHNKHNDPGQSGHKPPKPGPGQEKQG
jgi:hypothetical protein